jgi:acetyl esterase/lipase
MFLAFFGQILTGSAKIIAAKNINYMGNGSELYTLNVYHKKGQAAQQDVIVFIHGGSWNSGKKETYWWLGRNLAKNNIVTAVINYPLAPNATYKEMAMASAQAVKWVKENISSYGGNPNRIFLMGHSAGGHLCALINADPQYFNALGMPNPVKGVVLNDAFGLDMDEYLTKAAKDHNYLSFTHTFGTEPEKWKTGSPLFYVEQIKNAHLVLYGGKTYPAIQMQSERFYQTLKVQNVPTTLQVIKKKSHVPMISQMIFGGNKMYKHINSFLTSTN